MAGIPEPAAGNPARARDQAAAPAVRPAGGTATPDRRRARHRQNRPWGDGIPATPGGSRWFPWRLDAAAAPAAAIARGPGRSPCRLDAATDHPAAIASGPGRSACRPDAAAAPATRATGRAGSPRRLDAAATSAAPAPPRTVSGR